MRLEAEWLRAPDSARVMALLHEGGQGAWFVGGCVRNALIGAPVEDIDIATDARPERVLALAEAAGIKAVATGLEHGTVTLVIDHRPFEITTLRRDVATDGRHATVAFTDRIDEDAARRDFTINALYATADGTLLDPTGQGLADLAARRLRFIGSPQERITEDYLRILRFFRFHAWYADPIGGIDAEGLAACAELADGVELLSRERIGAEMKKLLSAPDCAPALATMAHAGVLTRILPGADPAPLTRLVALEQASAAPPDAIRRLAALGGQEPALNLRLSRADARRLELLRAGLEGLEGPGALAHTHGVEAAWDIIRLRAALFETLIPPQTQAQIARGAAAVFPVTPADLMPRLQGAALGQALKRLEADWIASDFTLGREALLARLP